MKKTSYSDILKSRDDLDLLLTKLLIPVVNTDRLHTAYDNLEKLNKVHQDDEKYRNLFIEIGPEVLSSSLNDTYIMHSILPYIQDIDPKVLKIKFKNILKGTLLHEETKDSNIARNYLFELFLYSTFKKADMHIEMHEPNPDLLLKCGLRHYHIECKRISADNEARLEKNIKKAVKQINFSLENKDSNCFGIIAISIDFIMTKNNIGVFNFEDKEQALSFLRDSLVQYIDKNRRMWQEKLIKDEDRIIAIMISTNIIIHTKKESIQSLGSHLTVNNVLTAHSEVFEVLQQDLKPLIRNKT